MKANYEDKIPKRISEVEFGNLYDVNKQLMCSQPALEGEALIQCKQSLFEWIADYAQQGYFMLLCHELRDYTVFNIKTNSFTAPTIATVSQMVDDVLECMMNRGTLLSIDLQEAGGWELWIKNDITNEAYMYLLFPYGAAVIEY